MQDGILGIDMLERNYLNRIKLHHQKNFRPSAKCGTDHTSSCACQRNTRSYRISIRGTTRCRSGRRLWTQERGEVTHDETQDFIGRTRNSRIHHLHGTADPYSAWYNGVAEKSSKKMFWDPRTGARRRRGTATHRISRSAPSCPLLRGIYSKNLMVIMVSLVRVYLRRESSIWEQTSPSPK